MKRQAGFTLIELLVAIVCSTVVTAAALSVLLLGVRTQRQSQEVTGTQMETRVLLSVLEKTLSSGEVTGVTVDENGWTLTGKDSNQPLMQYRINEKEIKSGAGAVLLDDVQNAIADYDGTLKLLRLTVTNGRGDTYTLTKRCTAAPTGISGVEKKTGEDSEVTWALITGKEDAQDKEKDITAEGTEGNNRLAFLNTLAGQVGSNGMILGESSGTDKWYATWYNSSFTKDTPWCACFLSWGINKNSGSLKFADVADGIVQLGSNWHKGSIDSAIPGDLIFFDWDGDGNANHVGALLLKDGNRIYTIEGNSGGMVAVRYYNSGDARIMGYGVLDWKTN